MRYGFARSNAAPYGRCGSGGSRLEDPPQLLKPSGRSAWTALETVELRSATAASPISARSTRFAWAPIRTGRAAGVQLSAHIEMHRPRLICSLSANFFGWEAAETSPLSPQGLKPREGPPCGFRRFPAHLTNDLSCGSHDELRSHTLVAKRSELSGEKRATLWRKSSPRLWRLLFGLESTGALASPKNPKGLWRRRTVSHWVWQGLRKCAGKHFPSL